MKTSNLGPAQLKISDFEDKSLLILDDDDPLRGRLARAMEKKGFEVKEAKSVAEGLNIVKNLTDLHGAIINASNNVTQKGANVEIVFPKV